MEVVFIYVGIMDFWGENLLNSNLNVFITFFYVYILLSVFFRVDSEVRNAYLRKLQIILI